MYLFFISEIIMFGKMKCRDTFYLLSVIQPIGARWQRENLLQLKDVSIYGVSVLWQLDFQCEAAVFSFWVFVMGKAPPAAHIWPEAEQSVSPSPHVTGQDVIIQSWSQHTLVLKSFFRCHVIFRAFLNIAHLIGLQRQVLSCFLMSPSSL